MIARSVFALLFAAMALVAPSVDGDSSVAQQNAALEDRVAILEKAVDKMITNDLLPPVLEIPAVNPLMESAIIYQAELHAPEYILYLNCRASAPGPAGSDVVRLACARVVYNPNAPMPEFLPE